MPLPPHLDADTPRRRRRPPFVVRIASAIAAAIAIAAGTASVAAAQDTTPPDGRSTKHVSGSDADARDADARDPFGEGAIGLEFGGALLPEAWNLNERREFLVDGSVAVWWNFTLRATLVVEFHAARVAQASSRAAFVNGFIPAVRWRLVERGANSVFVELGPGISWSDTVTPPRGTTFNYLIQGSAGWMHRLGRRTRLVASARWLHISNNSREGRARNPDIEAVGGYGGIQIAF